MPSGKKAPDSTHELEVSLEELFQGLPSLLFVMLFQPLCFLLSVICYLLSVDQAA